jgi:hypothetical protein
MNRANWALALASGLIAIVSLISIALSLSVPGIRSGKDWLAWTPDERYVFVEAFKAGYVSGSTNACNTAEELFRPREHVTDFSHRPSARCLQSTKSYSRPVEEYVKLITDFYTKCPKYQSAPDVYLMLLLTDNRRKSADELCQEGVRTDF